MINTFKLTESVETEKLKHLEHAEDHPINAGKEGFKHAVKTLNSVNSALKGNRSKAVITTKYDGAPSIVFGTHPETKKFFVSSKSAFNKNPKINYTDKDIEKNHGHAPGLVDKLKHALHHLPKVTPHGRVFQGDMMYTPGDVKESSSHYSFKPNTITYSVHKNSEIGKKVGASKIGVAVHTEYKGESFNNMKASFAPNLSAFKHHKDVHVIDTKSTPETANHTPQNRAEYASEIKKAIKANSGHDYSHLEGHKEHVSTYVNHTVRTNTTPSPEGLIRHIHDRAKNAAEKVKTEPAKNKIMSKAQDAIEHVKNNKEHFNKTFQIHRHLQNAKHALVRSLSSGGEFEHEIEGRKTGPEGHVAIIDGNKPTKLVDRSSTGFSAANLLAGGIKAKLAK